MARKAKATPFSLSTHSSTWKPVIVDIGSNCEDTIKGQIDDGSCEDSDNGHGRDIRHNRNRHRNHNHNHYDSPKLIRSASKDLPVRPGEDVAIFYGLEILENYNYKSASSPAVEAEAGRSPPNKEGRDRDVDDSNNKESKKKRKKKTKNSKPRPSFAATDNDSDHQDQETDQILSLRVNPKRPQHGKGSPATCTTQLGSLTDADDCANVADQQHNKKKQKTKTPVSVECGTVTPTSPVAGPGQDKDQATKKTATMTTAAITQDQLWNVSTSWSQATSGAVLHPQLVRSLTIMGFHHPTPIQAATLSAAIMGRRNLVGAAPTGSGKTLAFLLPILQAVLEQQQQQRDDATTTPTPTVQAVIVTPTRELATQIHSECDKLVPNKCVCLVGGIAMVKQKRLLLQKKPPILIGTPGRLWAMISSAEHDHLNDLSEVRFLVLDEADRMTQDHCFPQLLKILDVLHEANPRDDDDLLDDGSDEDDDYEDEDRMLSLPGIRGEAPLMMLNDEILQRIQDQKASSNPEIREVDDRDFPQDHDLTEEQEDDNDEQTDQRRKVHRQTFIYSATLTLPFTKTSSNATKQRKKKNNGLDGAIAEILDKTQAMGETKIVDLSSSKAAGDMRSTQGGVRLPPGLTLEQIKCTQRHKDSHLFAYLMTTAQGASGPCLVFCNSIAAVRRVGATLQTLGLSVRMLHANMQQRARFKAVESLGDSKKRCVVVCTDVAARGLDIPSISTIVHYDAARTVDTFVHRSGRTARGIGNSAVGSSLSLVSPAEDKAHKKICESLQAVFKKVLLDGRLMGAAQERVSLASKIVASAEVEQKSISHNRWFLEKAKEADLDIDNDLLETDDTRSERELAQLKEARQAKVKLARILREPMKTQRFGKFLSTNSAAMQPEIHPLVTSQTPTKKGNGKRKR